MTKQKVVISIPAFSGEINSECVFSLLTTQHLLNTQGIDLEVNILNGCTCLPVARNTLVAMFMKDPDATDLFFVDADVGFDATAFLKLLESPVKIVAGIYPLKRDNEGYPVKIKTKKGRVVEGKGKEVDIPIGKNGLIEAELLPTGFMRIKREVIEAMQKAYPKLKYKSSVVNIANSGVEEIYDLFKMGVMGNSEYTTEDFAFCKRWTHIGGQLWVYPDIDFTHTGHKVYKGNYLNHLLGPARAIDALKAANN